MYVGVRYVMYMVECACVYVRVCFQGELWRMPLKDAFLMLCFYWRRGFLEAADGMKRAAVKLEENQSENQIGSEASEGAFS